MSATTRARSPLMSLMVAMAKGFLRDKMTLFWAVAFPLMFLVLFGGIFTDSGAPKLDVVQVGTVAVLDDLPAPARATLSDGFELERAKSLDAALAKLKDGDIDGVVTQTGDDVTIHFSAADQVKAAQVQGWFQGVVQVANQAEAGVQPKYQLTTAQVEDDSLKSIQYVTPSLLGWAVAMSAAFGAALNLVSWRVNGLLRRLRLAPIRTSSVVMARIGVSLVVALVQAAIFIGLATALFGLKLTGWWPLVIPLLAAGTLAFLSIGMLGGAVSKTEEGAIGLANFVVLPMAFLSGSFFPLDGAPGWLRAISNCLPLKHLNDGMLDVMVRGQGPSAIVLPMVILLAFAVVLGTVAAKLFRWDR